jgi:hypothetical protein
MVENGKTNPGAARLRTAGTAAVCGLFIDCAIWYFGIWPPLLSKTDCHRRV